MSPACPGCGAPLEQRNPGMLVMACGYCGNVLRWDGPEADAVIRNAGRQAILPEGFTRLYRGATGRLGNVRFKVLGRIRYGYSAGFWDEWYLEREAPHPSERGEGEQGKGLWLTEDDHELILEEPYKGPPPGAFRTFAPSQQFSLGGMAWYVEEVGQARFLGMEGQLPRSADTGDSYPFVDASSLDGRYSLGIEYDGDPPTVFMGRFLKWASLTLDDEGDSW